MYTKKKIHITKKSKRKKSKRKKSKGNNKSKYAIMYLKGGMKRALEQEPAREQEPAQKMFKNFGKPNCPLVIYNDISEYTEINKINMCKLKTAVNNNMRKTDIPPSNKRPFTKCCRLVVAYTLGLHHFYDVLNRIIRYSANAMMPITVPLDIVPLDIVTREIAARPTTISILNEAGIKCNGVPIGEITTVAILKEKLLPLMASVGENCCGFGLVGKHNNGRHITTIVAQKKGKEIKFIWINPKITECTDEFLDSEDAVAAINKGFSIYEESLVIIAGTDIPTITRVNDLFKICEQCVTTQEWK